MNAKRRTFLALLTGIAFITTNYFVTSAAPGDLDRGFGNSGMATTPMASAIEEVRGLVVQADGKILVAGSTRVNSRLDLAILRFNPDGTLDNTFDGDGKVVTSISAIDDLVAEMLLQPDGKIVIGGTTSIGDNNGNTELMVVRFNPNGSLDTSFNGTGFVVSSLSSQADRAISLVRQSNGKLTVFGTTNIGNQAVVALRYNSDGSVDTSFGTNGRTVTSLSASRFSPSRFLLQEDGKIVIAGSSFFQLGGTDYNLAVARLNVDGTLDTSFDSDGVAVTKLGPIDVNQDTAFGAVIQPDGKIVAAGYCNNGISTRFDFAVVRYNPDGSLDTNFDNDGKVVVPLVSDYDSANTIALQLDGKLVLGGNAYFDGHHRLAMVRVNPNGSLDKTFGASGKLLSTAPTPGGVIRRLAFEANGKILAAGEMEVHSGDAGVARYLVTGIREYDFDGDKLADISTFRPSTAGWYILGSQAGFTGTQFGDATDRLTPADFDGDGRTDISVFRDGVWYWLNSSNGGFQAVQFGAAGDTPVPADYDGDGRADQAVYRSGVWYLLQSQAGFTGFQFGISTDKPVPGDFDGDGKIDAAVYRDGVWYLLRSQLGFGAVQFGIASDRPVAGDFDGDGRTDQAVYRAGTWYMLGSSAGFSAVQFGNPTDIPSPADYDGDGKTDQAVFRNGVWYLLRSQQGLGSVQFGSPDDIPVPSAYVP